MHTNVLRSSKTVLPMPAQSKVPQSAAATGPAAMYRSRLHGFPQLLGLAALRPTCIWARAPLLAGVSSKDASEPASLSASVYMVLAVLPARLLAVKRRSEDSLS